MEIHTSNQEILLHFHQSQHEEALQHRQSILNSFSLSTAGLLALLGGAIAAGYMSLALKCVVGGAAFIVYWLIGLFIGAQRRKTEEAMHIMRTIEKQLRAYDVGTYVPDEPLLPERFKNPQTICLGLLSRGDILQVVTLLLLFAAIAVVLYSLPISPPSP